MGNARLEEAQAEIKIARKISITSDMQMTPPLWQKEEELKSLLMKEKEEQSLPASESFPMSQLSA